MTRTIAAIILALLVLPAAHAGKLYKWVDENGTVHYSDSPREGAKEINPDEFVGVYEAPSLPPPRPRAEASQDQAPAYRSIEFISPKQDQVFWAAGGEIPVYIKLQPPLADGHTLRLFLNGNMVREKLHSTSTTLTDVWRGAHTLRVVVEDAIGQELAASETITFHVKQRSLANPQNPRPKPRN